MSDELKKSIHDDFAKLVREYAQEYGVKIESVQFRWIDSWPLIVTEVRVEASKCP